MSSLLERVKRRKLFQWVVAYVATGWLVAQVLDVVAEPWGLTAGLVRGSQALLALGLPLVLVLAWYHGEKGRQRVSGPEFVILTCLMLLGGTALAVFNPFDVDVAGSTVARADLGPNSIVVLPFLNNSSDPEQEYLTTGIAGELLNLLNKIPELEVISRTTAFSFKGRDDISIPEIAAQLGVVHVLEGTVQRAGNMIRITAHLIDARTDTHLFSESYDRVIENIFAIQDEIAAKVVSGLKLTILGELPTLRETDPEAYALFLQGQHILNGLSQQNHETAIEMFEQVLDIDPEYTPAHAQLAFAYGSQGQRRFRPFDEGAAMGIDAAQRAISLDPEYGLAHAALGWIRGMQGDIPAFAAHVRQALLLDPTHPQVLMNGSHVLGALGRNDEAIAVLEYIRDRDPLYLVNLANLAISYSWSGRWEEEATAARTALRLDPSFTSAHGFLADALLWGPGEYEAALAEAELIPDPVGRLQVEALANYSLGRLPEHEAALRELREEWGEAAPMALVEVYAFLKDVDGAFEWLERSPPIAAFGSYFVLDFLRDDPRWTAWIERADPSLEELAAIEFEVRLPR